MPRKRISLVLTVAALTALATLEGCTPQKAASVPAPSVGVTAAAAAAAAATTCGWAKTTPTYAHVVWIWMENKDLSTVIGSSNAPYESAIAKSCGLATNFHGITHPSGPNYVAATAGSTLGVVDDRDPTAHQLGADSIFGQLGRAGLSWKSYEESMTKDCDLSSSGRYIARHNPATFFIAVRAACATNDIPLEGNLQSDLATGSLPAFSFITPNGCNDGHGCGSTSTEVRNGDEWLATWIPRIVAGSNYQSGNTLIVLTWDEDEGSSANLIPTIVIAPSVPAGTVVSTKLDQYSLLRTTEDLLGLPALRAAKTATSMAPAFHL